MKLEQCEIVCSHCAPFYSTFTCCCMIFIGEVIRLICRKKTELFSHLIKAFKILGQSSLAMQKKKMKKPQHLVQKKGKHKASPLICIANHLRKIKKNYLKSNIEGNGCFYCDIYRYFQFYRSSYESNLWRKRILIWKKSNHSFKFINLFNTFCCCCI